MIEVIERTSTYKRGYKSLMKKHYDMSKIDEVLKLIVADDTEILKRKYKLQQLTGNFIGVSDVYIDSDWLLLYVVSKNRLKLLLLATGSHDDVLGKKKSYNIPSDYQ